RKSAKPSAETPAETPVEAEVEAVEPDVESAEPSAAELAETDSEAVPKGKALAPLRPGGARDALQQYMNEVGRYKLLTREEEHALAVKYRETGDVEAARTLVASNLRLVVKIAFEYHRTAFNVLD